MATAAKALARGFVERGAFGHRERRPRSRTPCDKGLKLGKEWALLVSIPHHGDGPDNLGHDVARTHHRERRVERGQRRCRRPGSPERSRDNGRQPSRSACPACSSARSPAAVDPGTGRDALACQFSAAGTGASGRSRPSLIRWRHKAEGIGQDSMSAFCRTSCGFCPPAITQTTAG